MVKTQDQSRAPNRVLGFRAVGEAVLPLIQPIVSKRRLGVEPLLERWPDIMGRQLSDQIWPERLVSARGHRQGGVLHLCVSSGAVAIEVQHLEPVIIERINSVFGFRAISRLRLVHGALPAAHGPQTVYRPSEKPDAHAPEVEDALTVQLHGIEDDELRRALHKLGRAVLSPKAGQKESKGR